MLDDRREASPGVKFKDAELIGNPIIVIFGKSLADGKVELRIRKGNEKREVALTSIFDEVRALVTI
jgi:prolyl-tRNA synthetase